MGNCSSHNTNKAPKQPCKERPPETDKAQGQQFFCHFKQKKPNTKIVLLFPLNKRQQWNEAVAGLGVRAQLPNEDATGVRGSFWASSMLRGAGDGPDRREHTNRRQLKVQILLLQLDARRLEEGRRPEGGARSGGGASAQWTGPKLERCPQRLFSFPVTPREKDAEHDQGKLRRRCTRSRP